jgi:Zn-dependent protease with chaperone function
LTVAILLLHLLESRQSMKQRTLAARALALVLVVLMAQPSWLLAVGSPPELPNPGTVAGISRDEQIQVGLQGAAEVYKQMPVLPDSSPVTQYVQRLGSKLVAQVPQQYSWPYQFHVVQQSDINAFALPGGPIFINIGTITAADNEAELAGVMAHEMTHVYMQHSAKQASKQSLTQGLAGLLGAVLPGGTAGNLARLGVQLGAGMISLRYSRADEAQADAGGAIITYKAGYNPKALADFFKKLEQGGGGRGPQFLSDHPNPGNREAAIGKQIANWPPKNFVNDSPEFASGKQAATKIKAYTAQEIANGAKQGIWAQQNARNGAVPQNVPASSGNGGNGPGASGDISGVTLQQVKPSNRFTQFQHQAFTISYPDNWQASGNQNSDVTIAPQAGVSQGSIAYGTVIGGAQDPNGASLDQATESLVQSLQESNPGLQASGTPQNIQVSGVQGRSVNLTGNSPIQQNGKPLPERDWLVTVPRPQGGLLYLVFIAPQRDFNDLHPTYQKMLQSLQVR